jgi:conserved oligomeric Golgi complex subunit 3
VPPCPLVEHNIDSAQENHGSNLSQTQDFGKEILEEEKSIISPPEATVARRAKSYSDFYDVVRAHLKKDAGEGKAKGKRSKDFKNEMEFAEWIKAGETELDDPSQEEYK